MIKVLVQSPRSKDHAAAVKKSGAGKQLKTNRRPNYSCVNPGSRRILGDFPQMFRRPKHLRFLYIMRLVCHSSPARLAMVIRVVVTGAHVGGDDAEEGHEEEDSADDARNQVGSVRRLCQVFEARSLNILCLLGWMFLDRSFGAPLAKGAIDRVGLVSEEPQRRDSLNGCRRLF